MFRKLTLGVMAAAIVLSFSAAQAQEFTGTLKKVKDSGLIVIGHRESSIPFSFYDNDQNVVGYSQEYSNSIVEAVKKTLGLSELKVKYIPLTAMNRIPLLQNETYDFECGSTTNNLERQKQVDFSNTLFMVSTRLLVHKDSGIKDFADLKGKPVVVTAGSTSEKILEQMNDRDDMKMRIISMRAHTEAFRTLESQRAVAFFIDDALLAGERSKSKTPGDWIIVGTPQSYEAYGCMLRKDDPQFKKLVDDTVAQAQTSGQAEQWFARWFTQPIPPKGSNMNFTLPDEMKELFKNPNNKAFQ